MFVFTLILISFAKNAIAALKVVHRAGYFNNSAPSTAFKFGEDSTTLPFALPTGLYVDSTGELYIADTQYHIVVKVTTDNIVEHYAGTVGSSGNTFLNDVPATESFLAFPIGVTGDSNGNIYVGDRFYNSIRKISPDGIITAFVGNSNTGLWNFSLTAEPLANEIQLTTPWRPLLNPDETKLYFFTVGSISDDNIPSTSSIVLLYVDMNDLRVRYVAGVSSEGSYGVDFPLFAAACINSNGDIFVTTRGSAVVYKLPVDESPATIYAGNLGEVATSDTDIEGKNRTNAKFVNTHACGFSPNGVLYIGDWHGVYKITSDSSLLERVIGSGISTDFTSFVGRFDEKPTNFTIARGYDIQVTSNSDEMIVISANKGEVVEVTESSSSDDEELPIAIIIGVVVGLVVLIIVVALVFFLLNKKESVAKIAVASSETA